MKPSTILAKIEKTEQEIEALENGSIRNFSISPYGWQELKPHIQKRIDKKQDLIEELSAALDTPEGREHYENTTGLAWDWS